VTPFGARVRELRRERGVTQGRMAAALGVSSAYLSALEHGKRGRPTWQLLQRIIGYLNVIWDDAEELERLAELSHPRARIDTSGLSPQATALANRLAEVIALLSPEEIDAVKVRLDAAAEAAEARQRAARKRKRD
jgi:transcriptional regulator with XRE-family HTH domain